MLGTAVRDPLGVEGPPGGSAGLGLLPAETVMERDKELGRVSGRNLTLPFLPAGAPVSGYEIHMGRTAAASGADAETVGEAQRAVGRDWAALELTSRNGEPCRIPTGLAAPDRPVFGCYLHGLFEDSTAVDGLSAWLHARRGLPAPASPPPAAPEPHSSPTSRPRSRLPAAVPGPADPLDRLADALDDLGILERLAPNLRPLTH
jgi:cobyric acid synthase